MEMKRLIHTCIELGGREGGRGWERMRRLNGTQKGYWEENKREEENERLKQSG